MNKDNITLISSIFENKNSSDNFKISKDKFFENKDGPIHPNRHTFYEIVFIIKGEGTHYIDSEVYNIQKGALYLLSPSQVHYWNQKNELKAYILRFDKSIFQNQTFFNNILLSQTNYIQLNNKNFKNIKRQLKVISKEFKRNKPLKVFALKSLLEVLLISIQRLISKPTYTRIENNLLKALNKCIEDNKYKTETSKFYAKEIGVDLKTLNTTIKDITGLSSGKYIRTKTIVEAKRLLLYTNLTSNEISYKLGFVDSAYFSRFFKRETSLSPKEFKEKYLS